MKRREFITLLGSATATWPLAVRAQQRTTKIPRIGFLALSQEAATPELLNSFRAGLRERGYVEGQNIAVEYRFAKGQVEQYPTAVAELVRLNVDVIVAWTTPAVAAAKRATSTIPIVMLGIAEPVELGFIASLARPGGNITGVSNLAGDLSSKLMELLAAIVPGIKRIAVLHNPSNPGQAVQLRGTEAGARSLGLSLQMVSASVPGDLEGAFARITSAGAQGIVVLAEALFVGERRRIAELALKARLPTIFQRREHVEAGGLVAYGSSLRDQLRYVAVYVDKILKGTKPADLPVEQPTKFELVINLKTAKALGLEIPPKLLFTADEVIE
jgi:putative ABC transport system substrate-binding protein